jgi:hypothetical protein
MDTSSTGTDREGRLIAHRMVLEALIREAAARSDDADGFWERLDELCHFQDHEEDPGVVTSQAYGIEATAALEVRRLVETARAGARGRAGKPPS